MTDPNRARSSIFNFDCYPNYIANPIDWSRIPMGTLGTEQNSQNTSIDFQYNLNHQRLFGNLSNFSFCTNQTPHPAQFAFQANSSQLPSSMNSKQLFLRCKRKTDSPEVHSKTKQHITDEKMAEHLSKLRISSETASSSRESDSMRDQRLYMCEEMRKLQTDSILPQSLLSRIQRPCTALVLWTPPRRLIDFENDENKRNNQCNSADTDLSNMDLDSV